MAGKEEPMRRHKKIYKKKNRKYIKTHQTTPSEQSPQKEQNLSTNKI
jgi:hypothetical protein